MKALTRFPRVDTWARPRAHIVLCSAVGLPRERLSKRAPPTCTSPIVILRINLRAIRPLPQKGLGERHLQAEVLAGSRAKLNIGPRRHAIRGESVQIVRVVDAALVEQHRPVIGARALGRQSERSSSS